MSLIDSTRHSHIWTKALTVIEDDTAEPRIGIVAHRICHRRFCVFHAAQSFSASPSLHTSVPSIISFDDSGHPDDVPPSSII